MSRFYDGAEKIEAWLDKPNVERAFDALAMWYIAAAALLAGVAVVCGIVALVQVVA